VAADPSQRWFDAEVDEMTLAGLAALAGLRHTLTERGLGEAVTVLDGYAETTIAEHAEED
jgi:hypothetical protein